jgi:hypothetical protein
MNYTQEARKAVIKAATQFKDYEDRDLIDYTDTEKDLVCRAFLENDFNWCDDILPPLVYRDIYLEWIEYIYGYYVGGKLHAEYRNAIYLNLESVLEEIIESHKAYLRSE